MTEKKISAVLLAINVCPDVRGSGKVDEPLQWEEP